MFTRRQVLPVAVLLLLTGAVAGCGRKTASSSSDRAVMPRPAISEAEARQFGMKFALSAGDPQAIGKMTDFQAMLDTAMEGLDMSAKNKRDFSTGVLSSQEKPTSIAGQLSEAVTNGGSCEMLRVHEVDHRRRVLIRLVRPNYEGTNYLDLVLARHPNGQVRAVDIYVFVSGELISQTLRRGALMTMAQMPKGILDRLRGAEGEFVRNMTAFGKMAEAAAGGRNREALSLYDGLPQTMKQDKNILLLRLRAAQGMDERTYAEAMEDFRRYYPNDPSVDLISIDYYILKKQYVKALEMVDRLDRSVGGDPYLNVLRAGIHLDAGNFAAARQAARQAAEAMPERSDGPMALLSISLAEKNHAETLRLLHVLEKDYGMTFKDLTTVPEYAEFVKSPYHAQWVKAHRNRSGNP
jgi:hypothetical protein